MTEERFFAPSITPEELYQQDKRLREWDAHNRKVVLAVVAYYRRINEPERAKRILENLWR